MKLKPTLLHKKELAFLGNGCQSQSAPKWVQKLTPQFVFFKSCQHHDAFYYRGGSEADRKEIDLFFYKEMKATIKKKAWWRRPLLHIAARLYYRAVDLFGEGSFWHTKRKRTYEDLQHGMKLSNWSQVELKGLEWTYKQKLKEERIA